MWSLIYSEFIKHDTFSLITAFVAITVISKYLGFKEGKRLFSIALMIVFHALLIIISVTLITLDYKTYFDISLVSNVFGYIAWVNLAVVLIFKTLLPKLYIKTPLILQDLIVAGASLVIFFALMSRAGYNISGLIATSAVLTAVIGFSLQDTLVNIMGGLSLQLDNSIKLGDWIKLDEKTSGKVTEIRWRYTAIETRNWETVIIPNSVLTKSQITVLGRRTNQPIKWRRWVYFNVDFRFHPNLVNETLRSAKIANISDTPEINCILMDLADSYGRYAVRYWLTDLAVDDPTDSEIRAWIYFSLKRAGIPLSIPAQARFVTEDSVERKERKRHEDLEKRFLVLKKSNLFTHMADSELERVAMKLIEAPFKKGETITKQNAIAHWLYLLSEGEVSINVSDGNGNQAEVARLSAVTFFGEMSLMTGARRSATVIAVTDVECYRLDKQMFQEMLKESPQLAEELAEILGKRKAELERVKENFSHQEHQEKIQIHKTDFLGKIKEFFELNDEN